MCAVTPLSQSAGIHKDRFKRQDTQPPWPVWMREGKGPSGEKQREESFHGKKVRSRKRLPPSGDLSSST